MPQPVVPVDPALPTAAAQGHAPPFDPAASAEEELDRQVRAYVATGVAALLGLDEAGLLRRVEPARRALAEIAADDDASAAARARGDLVPFVLVLDVAPHGPEALVPAMRHRARSGVSVVPPEELAGYLPVDGVAVAPGDRLVVGVDTGGTFRGTTPEAALATVRAAGRTPLTVEEGLALVVVRPDMLRPNRCFSLMGSRRGDQRVPAVWISAGRPKLGWCWDRNPHDWLGAAHAAARVAVSARGR